MLLCRRSGNLFSLLLITLALIAIAQEDEETLRTRNYLEEEHALSLDFVTPHTTWAKPYARGTVRALFFAPWYQGGMECREIVELMQRFDLDANAIYQAKGGPLIGDNNPGWYGGDAEAGTKRALRLLDTSPRVVFLNQLAPADLPEIVRQRLMDRVTEGAGLVVIGGAGLAIDNLQSLPRNPATPDGAYYTLGTGRVTHLPARPPLEYGVGWETAYDYQMEAQGRALLWAADLPPTTAVTLAAPATVAREDLAATALTISWDQDVSDAALETRLRRSDGHTHLLEITDRRPNSATVTLPVVRAGEYHLDATLRVDGAVVSWATAAINVSNSVGAAIMLEKDWAEVGERFNATIQVQGPVTSTSRLVARVHSADGRILAEKPLRLKDSQASFEFDAASWMPPLLRIEAVLEDDRGEVAGANALATITNRNRDQFNFVMWNHAGGDLAPYSVQSLAAHGVTAILQSGKAPLYFAESDIAFVPYAASFRASSHTTTAMLDPQTGVLKSGCVHDDAAMQKLVDDAVEAHRPSRERGVFAYSLGDENAVRASCLSPHCLRAYRGFLRDVYGDIAALNAEWGTTYATFEAITLRDEGPLPAPDAPQWFQEYFAEWDLLHRTDSEGAKDAALDRQIAFGVINDELRALQAANFPRWYDRQAFQNWSYVQWCKRYQKGFAEIDPEAWTGFEGTDSFSIRRLTTRSRQGGDLDAFVRELDYFGPYKGPANEVVRSIAPRGFPMGNWIGYEPEADVLLQLYWDQVCDRMNAIQWWRWDNLSGYHGYLLPTLAPFPAVKELLEDTQIVRDGLGTLLMHCHLKTDGIAMLYSTPSTYIQHVDGNPSYGDYDRDHHVWHEVLHDAGLQFEYVTDRMLRLGEFDASECRVLILPLAFAMSPEEAAVVREFVKGGGTVIADVRPAIYDGHCKPLSAGLLDDVFGIRRTGNREARGIDRMRIEGELGGKPVKMAWGNWHGKNIYPQMKVDPNVEVTSGKPLGVAYHIHYWTGLQSPMAIVNDYGQGKAILLNFCIFDAPAADFIRELLRASAVEAQVEVASADGSSVDDVEITRWRNGNDEILALLGGYAGEVRVTLPAPFSVYNVKDKTALGETTEFTTIIKPHRASVFTLLSRPPAPPTLHARERVERGDSLGVSVRIDGASGLHPLIVSLTSSEDAAIPALTQHVFAGDSTVKLRLPMALNDSAGQWRLAAADILTGKQASRILQVR